MILKTRIELETKDAKYFLNNKKYECYHLLDKTIVYMRNRHRYGAIGIIRKNKISCTVEYNIASKVFINTFIDGKIRESHSLIHLDDITYRDYITEDDTSAFNVDKLLMVTATRNDDDEYDGLL